jgi:hypothetical protein
MDRDVRLELYLSLVLLGADPMLRGALEAWHEGVDERALLADLRNWNEAKVLEMKEWLPTMSGAELEAARERISEYEKARAALGQEA